MKYIINGDKITILGNAEYLFSALSLVRKVKTIKPKWYELWKKPKIIEYEDWERCQVLLPKEAGDRLRTDSTLIPLALACMGITQARHAQLEYLNTPTDYIETFHKR